MERAEPRLALGVAVVGTYQIAADRIAVRPSTNTPCSWTFPSTKWRTWRFSALLNTCGEWVVTMNCSLGKISRSPSSCVFHA